MRNQRLVRLLDTLIQHGEAAQYPYVCNYGDCYHWKIHGRIWCTVHEKTCPIPKLRKARYELMRDRRREREVEPFTRRYLRKTSRFDETIYSLREAIKQCEVYIREDDYKTYHRLRKTQLEYRLSQIRKELWRRSIQERVGTP